jgi:PAS domain S-box-containing protein
MQGGRTALRDFVPLNINGKSSGRLWIYTDITEIKQAEKKLNIFATEIQAANTALRESRTSALNLMQDAIEARAVAEKANKDLLREVVERRRAEDALRENDQRFRLATEATGVGIWEWNVMTNQIRWDSQMFCIYGIAPTEDGYVQYSDWSGGVLPEDLPEQEAILHNTARHGGQSAREFRLRRREDGEYRTIQAVETVRLNAQGEIEWVVGTNLDVSERKRAEEALRRQTEAALHMSEQEFRSLAEAMPQIVWATRPDGWNIYFNQQWVDYTGLTMEESYGHGWITPFHPDDRQRAWDAWQRATQHIERYSMECRLRRADGVYRWWLIRGEPMRAENGEILKWFGTCTDIEELKLAEAELHEANAHLEQRVAERTAELRKGEERLQLAVSATNLGTWDYKPTTGALNWDARCKELFGLPPGTEVNYETFLTGLHPDDREHTHQVVQGAFDPASGGKYDIEYRSVGLTDGGRVRWIHATGQAFFNDAGQAVRFTGTVQDITESKRAEELIKASLAEKEIMLREIHHRVKNNLQVISSLVSLQADTLTDEEMRGEFNDVRDRVRSMALVHEKLYQTGDLAHMNFADYAASLLQYLWRSHGALAEKVRLNLKVASVTLPIESAVPCGLILNELAGNALKHAFPDNRCGEVTVGMEHDPVSGEVSLLVSDDGVGLPEGLEWRQARSLGLRLVQMLAGQLQGTVDTGPGPGAEFRVVFPLKGSNS